MIPSRSWLFVPGHRERMLDKAAGAEADAIILDLEDSVPAADKEAGRALVASRVAALGAAKRLYVRVNKSRHLYSFEDLLAVVRPGLAGIFLAMPDGPEDVALTAALIGEAEERNGVAPGSVGIVPGLETARGLQFAHQCALHPRVEALFGGYAKGADLERALHLQWSETGTEALFLKSRVVMAARAAGKLPIGGLWQQVHDLDGARRFAEADRRLGFGGQAILHPSSAALVNAVFSPSPDELAHYRAMVAAYEAAAREGRGAVVFAGEHIDLAHVETARAALRQAGEDG